MGTSESAIKKPSLAGGHWQRVGRAAFLCASAPHALVRPHAPALQCTLLPDRLATASPATRCRAFHPSSRFGRVARLRGGTGRPYISESFINNTTDCVTASGVRTRRRHSNTNCIRMKPTPSLTQCATTSSCYASI